MDKINEYLKRTRNVYTFTDGTTYDRPRPRIVCKDGFSISVQAGEYLCCNPRINGADEYDMVELGFPSEEDDLITDYADMFDVDSLTEAIYTYVPIEIVNELVEKHGGIVN